MTRLILALRKLMQPLPILCNQRFFLLATPTLELLFCFNRADGVMIELLINQFNRPSLKRVSFRMKPFTMLSHSSFNVVGDADIVRAVFAFENVDVHKLTRYWMTCFDFAQHDSDTKILSAAEGSLSISPYYRYPLSPRAKSRGRGVNPPYPAGFAF